MKKLALILVIFLSLGASAAEKHVQICFSDPERIRRGIPQPEEQLIRYINLSSRSFDGAFYDISSMRIADALVRASKRGVKVRLVTDSDNLSGGAIEVIMEAGIPVIDDNRSALMHNKFAVIDDSIVYTGSTNATDNCAFKNNNNSIIISSHELAQIYDAEFEEMFTQGIFGNKKEGTPLAPLINKYYVKIDDININAYFAPENNIEKIINSRIKKAEKSIRFMAFSFTSDVIGETMIEKFRNGILVEGIFERRGAGSEYSEYTKMLIEGIPVIKDRNRHNMHHKVIIIDDRIVITGSFNFSKNANSRNDENIILIDSPDVAAQYNAEFKRLYKRGRR